jgi:putative membrane-bound dehydrogenase-like protein
MIGRDEWRDLASPGQGAVMTRGQPALDAARRLGRPLHVSLALLAALIAGGMGLRASGGGPAPDGGRAATEAGAAQRGDAGGEIGDLSAELPRIAPKEPQEALQTFQLLPDFRIELVAAEPLIADPVAVAFDERGRVYVVCMCGYSEQYDERLSEVRLLEDLDRDGCMDRSTVFIDGLRWPTSVVCYDRGVFIADAPDILYCRDNDGDGRADERRVVFTGFGTSNVQGLLNSLTWGLDNRIHGATSSAGARVMRPGSNEPPLELRGRDFSFDPRTLEIRAESGGGQHGMTFDEMGRKYVCSNSRHMEMIVYEDRYVARNPYLAPPPPNQLIAVDGGQAEVFRTSPVEPWRIVRTRLRVAGAVPGPIEGGGRPAGYFTGATGIQVFRGVGWPKEFQSMVFVGDVGSNIVHRKRLYFDGPPTGASRVRAVPRAVRVDEGCEFLSSTDIWFRPVQVVNAPDGHLWVLDMYREVIEHPKSLPEPIKKHLDLTSGHDRGRIYRIAYVRRPKHPWHFDLDQRSTEELARMVGDPRSWYSETAARLVYERRDPAAIPVLRQGLQQWLSERRPRALYLLHALGALEVHDLVEALRMPDLPPMIHAMRLAEPLLAEHPELQTAVCDVTRSAQPHEGWLQAAFTLGEMPHSPQRQEALARVVRAEPGDPWLRLAVLSSLARGGGEMFVELANDMDFRGTSQGQAFLAELLRMLAAQGAEQELAHVVDWFRHHARFQRLRIAPWLLALEQGAARRGTTVRAILTAHAGGTELLADLLPDARQTVNDPRAEVAQRATAARMLGLGRLADEGVLLGSLLDARQPQEVQRAALDALAAMAEPQVVDVLLTAWPTLSPGMRSLAAEVLFGRRERLTALLDAVERGRIKSTELDPARIAMLLKHRDPAVRSRAETVFASQAVRRRDEVVQAYQTVLQMPGDVERGRQVFRKVCAACHRLEDHGQELGANLAAMRNRGAEAILLNVLDPNREVNPQYVNYVAETEDGRIVTGIIVGETSTSVTLARGEGQRDTLLRREIARLESTGLSIMPEGLEKQIDPQAMADLIAYLLSVK